MSPAPPSDPRIPPIQDYTPLAPTYDARRYVEPVHSAHEARRRRAMSRLLPVHVERAADVACGTGRGIEMLKKIANRAVAIDGTLAMLGLVREKLGMETWAVRANAAKLPFEDATFDLVISLNFLHLFPSVNDKTVFVSEMGRIVRPGGILIVEFDNALQGLMLGAARKYFGKDIGYDWPWDIRRCFRNEWFTRVEVQGASLPFVWRVPVARSLDNLTGAFPLNYLATKIFVRAYRR